MKQAEAADEEEDKRYGRDRQGEELPKELQRRETRIRRRMRRNPSKFLVILLRLCELDFLDAPFYRW
jgi:hypothetical protein